MTSTVLIKAVDPLHATGDLLFLLILLDILTDDYYDGPNEFIERMEYSMRQRLNQSKGNIC